VILVCGKREAEEGSVNIRRLGEKDQKSMAFADALTALQLEAEPPDVKRLAKAAA
jgi:threonyl-tRNA synthetase